jgi:arsenite methyltransferase
MKRRTTVSEVLTGKEAVHSAVKKIYGQVAETRNLGGGKEAACCGPVKFEIADYSAEELASVPPGSYLGEGSGTPVRHAGLQHGETVVDLGAGAGLDSFLAANRVGPSGRVYGFDLTPQMLERARANAVEGGYANVSFEQADIERLPLPDAAADAAISNCVINLTPDKPAVYREIFRVLKPGGRLSVSDIILRGDDAAVRKFREGATDETWCACVAGALAEPDYLAAIRAAGFADVAIVAERSAQIQPGGGLRAAAVTITARKPA